MTPTAVHLALYVAALVAPAADGQTGDPPAVAANPQQLAKANKLLVGGEFDKARALFEDLRAAAPADPAVLLGLGQSIAGGGDRKAAIDLLVRASGLLPADYDAQMALAGVLYDSALDDWAIEEYQAADFAFQDARRIAEQAAALRPTAADPWRLAARAERDRGDRPAAIALYEKAIALDPKDTAAQLELAAQLFADHYRLADAGDRLGAKQQLDRCRGIYADLLLLDPHNAWAYNGQAWIAKLDANVDAAADLFKQSLLHNPTLDDSYQNLTALLGGDKDGRRRLIDALDDVVEAAARYAAKDERQRGRATALYQRGLAHKLNRDLAKARSDLEGAARLHPPFTTACRLQIANTELRENLYDDAAATLLELAGKDLDGLTACVQADPDGRNAAVAYRNLVRRRYEAADLDGARTLSHLVAATLVDSPDDWNNYAFFCRESGHFEESYAAYQAALELNPTDPALLNDTALILQYHLGKDLDYAAELYERAIEQGTRVLADDAADSFAKDSARTAVRDAADNLKRLRSGGRARVGG